MSSQTRKFESLLEALPDAQVGMDRSGTILFVNHQCELLFGHQRDNLVGKHIETLVPEALWPIYLTHRDDFFADSRSRDMSLDLELPGRRRDGAVLPLLISLSPIDTGEVLLGFAAINELSTRRQAFDKDQRMTAIVEHSNDAIIGMTPRGTITSWNSSASKIYGYSAKEVIGKPIDVLEHEERAGEIAAILARIRAGQLVELSATVGVHKDGTPISVSVTVSPIPDENGSIVGASTITRDMTELRNAFDAARAMIEACPDSLVVISADGKITDANQATVRFTGAPREDLIGTDFSSYFTDPEGAKRAYQRVFEDGTVTDHPLTIRHRDGSLTDVIYGALVHVNIAGHVLAVFAAAQDVTKLVEAGKAARSMIESSLDSLVAISPEGKITDANEATVEVTGVTREELIGTAFSDYFTDPEKANRIYQLVFEEGRAMDYPLTIRHRDGSLAEVRYNASSYHDGDGNVLGVFASARDVTEQVRDQQEKAKEQSLATERLEELELFHRETLSNELRMIDLKKENEYLRKFLPAHERESPEKR